MLHSLKSFTAHFILLALLVNTASLACRRDVSGESEEEQAYLADYEAPSDRWGFIDQQGQLVIDAIFDDVGPFSEGLAAVNKGGKWGYIDREGKMVIEPVYKAAWAFHEGFARVQPFNEPDKFIRRDGTTLPAENWAAADDFSESHARVMVGNLFGYIDTDGKLVIQPLYTRGWNYRNGLAIVEFHEKLGVIDTSEAYVLPPEYDHIKFAAKDKIILARKGDDAYAFDWTGKEIFHLSAAKLIDSDGHLVSVRQGSQMHLVNPGTPDQKSDLYSNIIYLEEGRWAGKKADGYILLDQEGNPLTEQHYEQLNKFSDGFAAYSKGDYWGYIDISGNEVTGGVFGLAWDYQEGYARAAFKDGIAFIDKTQSLAFYPPPGSLDLRDFSEGLASVLID
jgi:hypothetical protein